MSDSDRLDRLERRLDVIEGKQYTKETCGTCKYADHEGEVYCECDNRLMLAYRRACQYWGEREKRGDE